MIGSVSFGNVNINAPHKNAEAPQKKMSTAAKVAIGTGAVVVAGATTLGVLAGLKKMPKWMPDFLNKAGTKISDAAQFVAKKAVGAAKFVKEKAVGAFGTVKGWFSKADDVAQEASAAAKGEIAHG